jgi:hypothetical protein
VLPPSKTLAHLTGRDYEVGLLEYLRTLFGFLTNAHGCHELPSKGTDELRFANVTTLIVIKSEWEGPWVGFDHVATPRNERYGALPLWVIMAIRGSKYSISQPNMPMIDRFVNYAQAIPECALDLLQGDFSVEPAVVQFCDEREAQRKQWEQNLHLDSAVARASDAFRNKEFDKVIEYLLPYQDQLPEAQAAKLAYALRETRR